jgi:hypothetical protein
MGRLQGNDIIYVKSIYNFSYTHSIGDTIVNSFDPQNKRIKRAIEYLIEDLSAEVVEYMKSKDVYPIMM